MFFPHLVSEKSPLAAEESVFCGEIAAVAWLPKGEFGYGIGGGVRGLICGLRTGVTELHMFFRVFFASKKKTI